MTYLFPEIVAVADQGEDLIIDLFAGGGGVSTGIEMALGRSPDYALNHDGPALAMHMANHPQTIHIQRNINQVDPMDIVGRRRVGLLWASPDCKHHSVAKGGKPVKRSIRDLAWSAVLWARRARPKVIFLENVVEFADWGPLIERKPGKWYPDPDRKGETFNRWVKELRRLGYKVEWEKRRCSSFGDPTIRRRLFLIARCDGLPIVWPAPTHDKPCSPAVITGNRQPWRTAADQIDWSLPVPSIFDTREEIKEKYGLQVKRPLVPNTEKRIAVGVYRHVIKAKQPFIVTCNHGGDWFRGQGLDVPFNTVTAARDAHGLVVPILSAAQHGGYTRGGEQPMHTITASPKDQNAVIVPTLVQTGYGERKGQAPRVPGLEKPIGTIVAGGGKHALVAAFLAQHNTDLRRELGVNPGRAVSEPLSTITVRGTQQAVVAAHMMSLKGTDRRDRPVDAPLGTVCAGGGHAALVAALMIKYYGAGIAQAIDAPCHTIPTKARFALVTVTINGTDYVIVDIGMRMLTARELFNAQGFPSTYKIAPLYKGKPLPKTKQISCCGNSVPPNTVAAHIAANCNWLKRERLAA